MGIVQVNDLFSLDFRFSLKIGNTRVEIKETFQNFLVKKTENINNWKDSEHIGEKKKELSCKTPFQKKNEAICALFNFVWNWEAKKTHGFGLPTKTRTSWLFSFSTQAFSSQFICSNGNLGTYIGAEWLSPGHDQKNKNFKKISFFCGLLHIFKSLFFMIEDNKAILPHHFFCRGHVACFFLSVPKKKL